MVNNVRQWRQDRDWSLVDAAGLTGLSVSYISKIERGHSPVSPALKVRIARGLGAKVGDLFPTTTVDAEPELAG